VSHMALTEQEILVGLGEILDEVAGVPADQVTPEKTFVDDLDIDSLSMVEIAVAAQDKFGVEIPDDHLKDLTTVQGVIDYVLGATVAA
jgi:acyl carrier protein